jgi:cobalt-zinc-cadmium resistance protein CzcA
VLIILVVFVPVFTLEGVEGKTFLPMAQTVSFAILGSLLLSITYVPVMSSILLKRKVTDKENFADRMMTRVTNIYVPSLRMALNRPIAIISATVVIFFISIFIFLRMGAEFVPTLEEGDLAMQMSIPPGSSLSQSIATSTAIEKILKDEFPEVNHVVSKIGTAEVPTDPMAIEDADIMILLKEREEWTSANSREELIAKMKDALADVPNVSFEFTQPIQLRFNELMTGAKTDIAIKIFGEDVVELKHQADHAAAIIREVQGAGDVKVEQTAGLRQLTVRMNRQQMAMFGINVEDVNTAIRAAYAGEVSGSVYENERRFDLVLRLAPAYRERLNLSRVFVHSSDGAHIPLSQVAEMVPSEGPMMISREDAKRRISIGVNVRDRDVASLVGEIEQRLNAELDLPPGYSITYGGQFENLQHATARLMIAVPVALLLILFLLYLAFDSMREALVIFAAVPLAAVGGILALELRGLPFSISAGIGFIALFGVAVLNGLVLVNEFIRLRGHDGLDLKGLIEEGATGKAASCAHHRLGGLVGLPAHGHLYHEWRGGATPAGHGGHRWAGHLHTAHARGAACHLLSGGKTQVHPSQRRCRGGTAAPVLWLQHPNSGAGIAGIG